MELITVKHFWRLLVKAGFRTIKSERELVTSMAKSQILHDIFEVKALRKIMGQLGIVEDVPISTKNFTYDNLSGIGIRIINKVVREMKERKITDVKDFIGRDNIVTKKLIAQNKSEEVEAVAADDFLKVLRNFKIMKRWEDLDENLQDFLSLPINNNASHDEDMTEFLMVRKFKKCVQDFQNCEFFEYYGFTARVEGEIDSEDEPEDLTHFENMRNKLTTVK